MGEWIVGILVVLGVVLLVFVELTRMREHKQMRERMKPPSQWSRSMDHWQ
jgi:uncharacterized integral membrane protein